MKTEWIVYAFLVSILIWFFGPCADVLIWIGGVFTGMHITGIQDE